MSSKQQSSGIVNPHEHDVLSGRGNFVNYHAGNEHFRALVRKHKLEYVRCPKPQKGKFSRMIVDEIKNRTPPGRFLKQDNNTKLWYDIGEKKALDKTRQALREGAPEIMKEINGEGVISDDEPLDGLGPEVRSLPYAPYGALGCTVTFRRNFGISFPKTLHSIGLLAVVSSLPSFHFNIRMPFTHLVVPLVWAEQVLLAPTRLGHMRLPAWLVVCYRRCSLLV